jgi:Arc/MetJ family transcription regulator
MHNVGAHRTISLAEEEMRVRLNVELDPRLLEEAVEVSGARSKREAIETALREMVRRHRIAALIGRAGSVPLSWSVEDLVRGREEE